MNYKYAGRWLHYDDYINNRWQKICITLDGSSDRNVLDRIGPLIGNRIIFFFLFRNCVQSSLGISFWLNHSQFMIKIQAGPDVKS